MGVAARAWLKLRTAIIAASRAAHGKVHPQFPNRARPTIDGDFAEIKRASVVGTHRFKFDQILEAYDAFSRAAETQALKVVIVA